MDTYLVYGIKRGGHHAVLQWIAQNLNNKVYFQNDCDEQLFIQNILKNKGRFTQTIYNPDLNDLCQIYNFENGDLTKHQKILESKFVDNHLKTIIVIRDIFNIIASTIKSTPKRKLKASIDSRIQYWKQYAKEMLHETNYLNTDDKVFVSYNHWFSNKNYRDTKAQKIGFINKDYGLQKVTPYGGASSFDKNTYQGNAHKMKVLTRYENYLESKQYLNLFPPEVQKLNKEIFGFNLKDLLHGYNITNNTSQ